jgi:hypothetical protein
VPDNSADIVLGNHKQPLPELRRSALVASLVLPTAPSSNDAAKQERDLAIAGSYVMNNELLPQSHAFTSKQQSFNVNYTRLLSINQDANSVKGIQSKIPVDNFKSHSLLFYYANLIGI